MSYCITVNPLSAIWDVKPPFGTAKRLHHALLILCVRYGPRVIDVDILCYGDEIVRMDTEEGPLFIPHERIAERAFVLAPFCDIAPGIALGSKPSSAYRMLPQSISIQVSRFLSRSCMTILRRRKRGTLIDRDEFFLYKRIDLGLWDKRRT